MYIYRPSQVTVSCPECRQRHTVPDPSWNLCDACYEDAVEDERPELARERIMRGECA